MRELIRNKAYYMTPEDDSEFSSAAFWNNIRLPVGVLLGIAGNFWVRKQGFFKKSFPPGFLISRLGIMTVPIYIAIRGTPTPRYSEAYDQVYIKYYKPVCEELIKEDKLQGKNF